MNRALILTAAFALTACDVEGETTALDQLAPPGNTPEFVVSEAMPGATVTMRWAGLTANAPVRFFVSRDGAGAGPCPSIFAGGCYGIVNPIQISGTIRADADGIATHTVTLPSTIPNGTPFTFQAASYTPAGGPRLSNTFERYTGFGICGFIFQPVCTVLGNTYDNECIAHTQGEPVDYFDFAGCI